MHSPLTESPASPAPTDPACTADKRSLNAEELTKILSRARTTGTLPEVLLEQISERSGPAVVALAIAVLVEKHVLSPIEVSRTLVRSRSLR